MPIDPSIIGNVMAPQAVQMPDMNAMMQNRTAGMENIYQIETARQAQAAEAAKAQEAEAIKALSPAIAAAFEDPSDAGLDAAFSLVPEEFGAAADEQLTQLRAIPDINRRKAVIRSALLQDDYGRALLAQLEPTANMQLQAKTAAAAQSLAEQRLQLDKQKAALDAEGKGDWTLQEGEDGFFWVNPRTREVVPANVTGGAAPGAIPAPDVVTPRQPAPGAPEVAPPVGVVQPPAFKPKSKKEDALTEAQGKSFDFALRMIDSDAIANELEKQGVVTTDAVSNFFTGVVRAFPDAVGRNLADQIENAFNAASPTLTPEEQRLARAQLDFVTAKLRSESGAEIKASEFPSEYKKYFPVAGDEGNEKLLSDKRRARKLAIAGMRAKAGAGNAEIDRIIAEQGAGAPAAAVPAAPGAADTSGFKIRAVRQQ